MIQRPKSIYTSLLVGILSFTLLTVGRVKLLSAQVIMGARGVGMGKAVTSLPHYEWSSFANPAMMPEAGSQISFYGIRNYGLVELTDIAATGSIPSKIGVFGLGLHRFGDELFNETRIRGIYKKSYEGVHIGVVLNYSSIAFGGENLNQSLSAVGVDAGLATQIIKDLWMGARATNLNRPEYGPGEDLPRELAAGFSYLLAEKALFSAEVVKDVRFPVSYRSGVEVQIIDQLFGRIGLTTEPDTYSFGFGYRFSGLAFGFAAEQHSVLGLSPAVDVNIIF